MHDHCFIDVCVIEMLQLGFLNKKILLGSQYQISLYLNLFEGNAESTIDLLCKTSQVHSTLL